MIQFTESGEDQNSYAFKEKTRRQKKERSGAAIGKIVKIFSTTTTVQTLTVSSKKMPKIQRKLKLNNSPSSSRSKDGLSIRPFCFYNQSVNRYRQC